MDMGNMSMTTLKKRNKFRKSKGTMSIVDKIDAEYRAKEGYGIQFSIDADAYECRLGDRVMFGESVSEMQCGTMYNWQDILLDDKVIGWLEESRSGKLLHPMVICFSVWLADCTEEGKITNDMRKNPHFCDAGEYYCMRFATLNQMLDYLKL